MVCTQNYGEEVNSKGNTKKARAGPRPVSDPVMAIRLPLQLRSSPIEAWAKEQPDKPSRSEAIRRLIEFALTAKSKRRNADGN